MGAERNEVCGFCGGDGLVLAEAVGMNGSTCMALMHCPDCDGRVVVPEWPNPARKGRLNQDLLSVNDDQKG